MKQVIIFEAEDGTRFNTEPGCLQYEAILAKVTAALDGLWHPGADNHLFNTGRQPVAHQPGTRERLWASLLPIFKEAMPARRVRDDGEFLQWLSSYFFENPSAWPCLRMAHNRLMSIDKRDREWCNEATRMESDGWRADFWDEQEAVVLNATGTALSDATAYIAHVKPRPL